ncbi:hypothetical protein [Burkholderia ubonensis]|uniref:hypothetical protein n=1 Tax=Burkholderia ubonensis TaxID=101571 RepID=UPI000AB87D45|nr:hypothetical protein [Burkholderia ubonensis]
MKRQTPLSAGVQAPQFRLVAVGPARVVPISVMVSGPYAPAELRPVDVCIVQAFERFRESGPRVDFAVVVKLISADGIVLHHCADEFTGDDLDELLDYALSGGPYMSVDGADEVFGLEDA